jgi:hypothetical protein
VVSYTNAPSELSELGIVSGDSSLVIAATGGVEWLESNGLDPQSRSLEFAQAEINGNDCNVVRWRHPSGSHEYELWLGKVDGMPWRIAVFEKAKLAWAAEVEEAAEIPLLWKLIRYGENSEVLSSSQFAVSQRQLNVDVDDAQFSLDFPKGSTIVDLTTDPPVRFTYGESPLARRGGYRATLFLLGLLLICVVAFALTRMKRQSNIN